MIIIMIQLKLNQMLENIYKKLVLKFLNETVFYPSSISSYFCLGNFIPSYWKKIHLVHSS